MSRLLKQARDALANALAFVRMLPKPDDAELRESQEFTESELLDAIRAIDDAEDPERN